MPKVIQFGFEPFKGGLRVTAFAQSARGTKYRVGEMRVNLEGRTKEERDEALRKAIEALTADPSSL